MITTLSLSQRSVGFTIIRETRRRSAPDPVHQQQSHEQGPCTDWRQEKCQWPIGLQQEEARIGLPDQKHQHAHVHRQSPPAGTWPAEMRADVGAATPVMNTPAEITRERHVEEEDLWSTDRISFYTIQDCAPLRTELNRIYIILGAVWQNFDSTYLS